MARRQPAEVRRNDKPYDDSRRQQRCGKKPLPGALRRFAIKIHLIHGIDSLFSSPMRESSLHLAAVNRHDGLEELDGLRLRTLE